MYENWKATVERSDDGSYTVKVLCQNQDWSYSSIQEADEPAQASAAKLLRRSSYHYADDSLLHGYIVHLYNFATEYEVNYTDFRIDKTVAIDRITGADISGVEDFLMGLLLAVKNADIQGTLFAEYNEESCEISCEQDLSDFIFQLLIALV